MTTLYAKAGETVKLDGQEHKVRPTCESKVPGAWACVTHDQSFRNNLERAGHTSTGNLHVLVWICSYHGIEEP